MAFNQLSDAEAERLALLLEELGEAQQVIGKILRHGYESYNPDAPEQGSNRNQLEREVGDVLASILIMHKSEDIDFAETLTRRNAKLKKVQQYLHHNGVPGSDNEFMWPHTDSQLEAAHEY